MVRKPAPRWTRFGIAAVPWALVVWFAQGALGPELGRSGRPLQERIEMQLKGGGVAPQPKQPDRSHEDSMDPWELVSV
jgi:hypothetical protein